MQHQQQIEDRQPVFAKWRASLNLAGAFTAMKVWDFLLRRKGSKRMLERIDLITLMPRRRQADFHGAERITLQT